MIFFICRSVLPDCPVSAASGVLAPLSMMKKLLLFVALLGLALPLRAQDDKALAAAAAPLQQRIDAGELTYNEAWREAYAAEGPRGHEAEAFPHPGISTAAQRADQGLPLRVVAVGCPVLREPPRGDGCSGDHA